MKKSHRQMLKYIKQWNGQTENNSSNRNNQIPKALIKNLKILLSSQSEKLLKATEDHQRDRKNKSSEWTEQVKLDENLKDFLYTQKDSQQAINVIDKKYQ